MSPGLFQGLASQACRAPSCNTKVCKVSRGAGAGAGAGADATKTNEASGTRGPGWNARDSLHRQQSTSEASSALSPQPSVLSPRPRWTRSRRRSSASESGWVQTLTSVSGQRRSRITLVEPQASGLHAWSCRLQLRTSVFRLLRYEVTVRGEWADSRGSASSARGSGRTKQKPHSSYQSP